LSDATSYTFYLGTFAAEIALVPAAPSIANAGLLDSELVILATGIGRQTPYLAVGPYPCEVGSVQDSSFAGVSEIRAVCPRNIPVGIDLPVSLIAAETRALPVLVRK
jgi:hypothetical protein